MVALDGGALRDFSDCHTSRARETHEWPEPLNVVHYAIAAGGVAMCRSDR